MAGCASPPPPAPPVCMPAQPPQERAQGLRGDRDLGDRDNPVMDIVPNTLSLSLSLCFGLCCRFMIKARRRRAYHRCGAPGACGGRCGGGRSLGRATRHWRCVVCARQVRRMSARAVSFPLCRIGRIKYTRNRMYYKSTRKHECLRARAERQSAVAKRWRRFRF